MSASSTDPDIAMTTPIDESSNSASDAPELAQLQATDDDRSVLTSQLSLITLCRVCGYDLVGLPHDALCPECGSPIAQSIRTDALINSSPVWLSTLSRGASLVFWATFTQFALLVVGRPVLAIVFNALSTSPIPSGFIIALFNVLLSILIILGLWMLTRPEHELLISTPRRLALAARWSMFSALGIAFISYSQSIGGAGPNLHLINFILYCLYTVAWGLTLLHAAHLFIRMGQHKRATNARVVAWGLIITAAVLMVSIGIVSIAAPGGLMITAVPVMCGAMILMALFIVAALVSLAQLMASLGIVATYARRVAARSSTQPIQ